MTFRKPISRRNFVSGAGRIALATAGAGLFPCSALVAPASAAGLAGLSAWRFCLVEPGRSGAAFHEIVGR